MWPNRHLNSIRKGTSLVIMYSPGYFCALVATKQLWSRLRRLNVEQTVPPHYTQAKMAVVWRHELRNAVKAIVSRDTPLPRAMCWEHKAATFPTCLVPTSVASACDFLLVITDEPLRCLIFRPRESIGVYKNKYVNSELIDLLPGFVSQTSLN